MTLLISILGIIITILFIVGIHEFGHFIVARLLGIKVLRFSIGFGKTLYRWFDKKGTEYVIAAIPLGGYVKMLDETEEKVPKEDLPYAYNRQPIYKKILVVLAGPLSNFILAFFLYWLIFLIGFNSIIPVIGKVRPDSIANFAGLTPNEEIVSINHQQTLTWMQVNFQLADYIGESIKLPMETRKLDSSILHTYLLDLNHWKIDSLKPDPLNSLGIEPYEIEVPNVIGKILKNSPAAQSDLKVGDKILSIENKPVNTWMDALNIVSKYPDQTVTFKIERQGKILTTLVAIGSHQKLFAKKNGFLGVAPDFHFPANLIRKIQYGPLMALSHAKDNTLDFLKLNFVFIGKLFTGKISVQSLGGPITIFGSAGSALNIGWIPFLSFLAFISIAIGVINLFPIPGLDGGHILIHLIEAIMGHPLSQNLLALFYRLGLILLIVLLIQSLMNDLLRLSS